MVAWPFAGEVVGLRGAGHGGERRVYERRLAKREELGDRRGVRADVPLSQPDDVENGGAFHGGNGSSPGEDERLLAAGLSVAQFVDRLDHQREIHLVYLEPLAKLAEQRDRQFAAFHLHL